MNISHVKELGFHYYTHESKQLTLSRVGSTLYVLRPFFFNILLTVHLSIILVINQLNAQILVL
jgi:hypothetical protein